MHKLTFFPLGKADSCRVDLANGRKILFDFAATGVSLDPTDKRCDLPRELKEDLREAGRTDLDVLVLTHLDKDHIQGASDFFWFEHDEARRGSGRVKVRELWVPVGVLLEELPTDDDHEEHRAIQEEAAHRFRAGKGIRVFGRPKALSDWCRRRRVSLEDREHLVTDAGRLVPGFSIADDGVEFFAHSPFAWRIDDETKEDRNRDNILLQATFLVGTRVTRVLFTADSPVGALGDVVDITRGKGNDERLEWHVAKAPHHCSYKSVGPEKGEDRTSPTDQVRWLWEEQQQGRGIIVSSSPPIPTRGSEQDENDQPPHRQAAAFYKSVLRGDVDDDFRVTMEYPNRARPRPLVIVIDDDGPEIDKAIPSLGATIVGSTPPRAG